MNEKKEKNPLLVDDPVQREKNIIEFVRKFWEEHPDLMRSLAALDDEDWEESTEEAATPNEKPEEDK